MAGVALIMIAGQLGRVTGVLVTGQDFAAQVRSFADSIGRIRPATLTVAVAVLAFLYLVRWRWPHAPATLLAILLATAAVAALGLASRIPVVGPVPGRPSGSDAARVSRA
jgi:sulfate permease, SulP family